MDDDCGRSVYKTGVNIDDMPTSESDESDESDDDAEDLDSDDAMLDVMAFAEETLDFLHQLREDHPDAMFEGQTIDQHIAQFEEMIANARKVNREYEDVKCQRMESYAKMLLAKQVIPSPFWSFAATFGRDHQTHPIVRAYFDLNDLKAYLKRRDVDPSHLDN